ncbi:TrbG/VirB9 family P-type conjugative transfer protein [Sphingomonas sp.]|uniref:TrbG/VirB9 family P-type conjugative transfer protein n=1 Tax=Sphingomonas sp. TaxID=28214 RepID=UPI0031DDEEE2
MKLGAWAAYLALTIAAPALGQYRPQPSEGDPRLQIVEYRNNQVVTLEVAPGYQLSLEFAADERIESVGLGDSAAWMVTPTKRGDHLFIKPVQGGVSTNMTVVTDIRTYAFDLHPLPGPSPTMAYTVRFAYPAAPEARTEATATASPLETRYRVSGDRKLRPSGISDDGVRTYIEWPANAAMPAVYAINDQGRETLANGVVQDGLYVIDGVARELVFRIDKQRAKAVRIQRKVKR